MGAFVIIILLTPVHILILTSPEILLYYTLLQALEQSDLLYCLSSAMNDACRKKNQQTSIFPLQQQPRLMEIALFFNIPVIFCDTCTLYSRSLPVVCIMTGNLRLQ